MDFVPFDTVGLSVSDFDDLYKTYNTLKAKFDIQSTGNIDFHLDDFEAFRLYKNTLLRGSFIIKGAKTDCYILFVETNYFAGGSKTGNVYHKVQQAWAVAYVKQDFGRVLIRRETLTDKIIELVHPLEIDFAEDKPFSDTFYVLANDSNKAVAAINRNFRNAVMDVRADNFVIEVIGTAM